MATEKISIPEEFEPFIDKVIRVTGIDGKSRKGKWVAVYQYSIILETKKIRIAEELETLMDKVMRDRGRDRKSRKGKLVAVYQYSIMLETNINTKENPIEGYMLYMKHAIKSVSQIAK